MKFKSGDWVMCVEDTDDRHGLLKKNSMYKVELCEYVDDFGEFIVKLENKRVTYSTNRFMLLSEARKQKIEELGLL